MTVNQAMRRVMRSKRKLVGLSTEIQPRVDRPCTVDEPTQSRSTLTDPGFASGVSKNYSHPEQRSGDSEHET